jgi:hypothetical protein
MTVERAGTFILLLITTVVLIVVGLSEVLSLAADDLYASNNQARGIPIAAERGQPGIWLSAQLAADLPPADLVARNARADQLAYRSERVREAASVAALLGLLVALLTARPGTDEVRGREVSSPAANTISSGTV